MYENTHEPTTWQCKYRVLAIQFVFRKKFQFIVLMLRVFIAHFRPVKFSKNHFPKKGQTPGFIKGDYTECELCKMPLESARSLYLKHQLSAASELSPNEYNVPVGFNHTPYPLTWCGYSRANEPCFNFLHCPLSVGKCGAIDIQRQIWQYKVKHDRWWRKLPRQSLRCSLVRND